MWGDLVFYVRTSTLQGISFITTVILNMVKKIVPMSDLKLGQLMETFDFGGRRYILWNWPSKLSDCCLSGIQFNKVVADKKSMEYSSTLSNVTSMFGIQIRCLSNTKQNGTKTSGL